MEIYNKIWPFATCQQYAGIITIRCLLYTKNSGLFEWKEARHRRSSHIPTTRSFSVKTTWRKSRDEQSHWGPGQQTRWSMCTWKSVTKVEKGRQNVTRQTLIKTICYATAKGCKVRNYEKMIKIEKSNKNQLALELKKKTKTHSASAKWYE